MERQAVFTRWGDPFLVGGFSWKWKWREKARSQELREGSVSPEGGAGREREVRPQNEERFYGALQLQRATFVSPDNL